MVITLTWIAATLVVSGLVLALVSLTPDGPPDAPTLAPDTRPDSQAMRDADDTDEWERFDIASTY